MFAYWFYACSEDYRKELTAVVILHFRKRNVQFLIFTTSMYMPLDYQVLILSWNPVPSYEMLKMMVQILMWRETVQRKSTVSSCYQLVISMLIRGQYLVRNYSSLQLYYLHFFPFFKYSHEQNYCYHFYSNLYYCYFTAIAFCINDPIMSITKLCD